MSYLRECLRASTSMDEFFLFGFISKVFVIVEVCHYIIGARIGHVLVYNKLILFCCLSVTFILKMEKDGFY